MSDVATSTRPETPQADGMRFFRRVVPPDLADGLVQIVGYAENGQRLVLSAEAAPLSVPLIISFAQPFEIALGRAPGPEERYGSFTSGLFPGVVLINSTGRSQCIQIDFTPLGARRFFGLPMHEISERMVHLADLSDAGIAELRRRLEDMPDWDARLRLAETFVRDRLGRAPAPDARLDFAWRAIVGRRGDLRIGALAHRLGWSRKHLVARFRDEIGVAPKTVARMARFNGALAMAAGEAAAGWADIAAACGYADQAHFSREFLEFSGRTPGEWAAGRA